MKNHELDQLRFDATEVENHYIDEYMAGRISRQRLLQLGTGIGMSLPLLGMFGTASALASPKSARRRPRPAERSASVASRPRSPSIR